MTPKTSLLALLALAALARDGSCADKASDPATKSAAKASPAAPKAAAKADAPAGKEHPGLKNPALAAEKAPNLFKARLKTTKGDVVVAVHRDWSPLGADRFYNLVQAGFFKDVAFFRAIEGFMVQFGIHGSPEISAAWRAARFPDDPPIGISNTRGRLTFATAGPGTRTTQLFINYGNNARLDGMGFTPLGEVVGGMDVLDSLYKGYGEGYPSGSGPNQALIQQDGNKYLKAQFEKLDYILSAKLEK